MSATTKMLRVPCPVPELAALLPARPVKPGASRFCPRIAMRLGGGATGAVAVRPAMAAFWTSAIMSAVAFGQSCRMCLVACIDRAALKCLLHSRQSAGGLAHQDMAAPSGNTSRRHGRAAQP